MERPADSAASMAERPRIPCRGEGIPPAVALLRDPRFNVEAVSFSESDAQRLQSAIDYENQYLLAAAARANDAREKYLDTQLLSPSSVVTPGVTVQATRGSAHKKSTYKTMSDGRMEVRSAAAHQGEDPSVDAAEETYKSMWESSTAAVIAAYLDIAKAK